MEEEEKILRFADSPFWLWWKRYGDHLTAPLILIALVILGFGLYDDNQLQKEISNSCGWGEEDYFCTCLQSEAIAMQNRIDNPNYKIFIDEFVSNDTEYNLTNYFTKGMDGKE